MNFSFWFAKDNPEKLVALFNQTTDKNLRDRIVNRLIELNSYNQLTSIYLTTRDRSLAKMLIKRETTTTQTLKMFLSTSQDKEIQVLALNRLAQLNEWNIIALNLHNKQLDQQVLLKMIQILPLKNSFFADQVCTIAQSSNDATLHQVVIDKLIAFSDTDYFDIIVDAKNISISLKSHAFKALAHKYSQDADKLKDLYKKAFTLTQREAIVDQIIESGHNSILYDLLNYEKIELELFSKIDNHLFETFKNNADQLAEIYFSHPHKKSAFRYVEQLCSLKAVDLLIKFLNVADVPREHLIKIAQRLCSISDDVVVLITLYHQVRDSETQDLIISRLCDLKANKTLLDILRNSSLSNTATQRITQYFNDLKELSAKDLTAIFKKITDDSLKLRIIDRLVELKSTKELMLINEKQYRPLIVEHIISIAKDDNSLLLGLFNKESDDLTKKSIVDALIDNNAISILWELENTDYFDYIVSHYFSVIYNNTPLTMRNLSHSVQNPEARYSIVSKASATAILEMVLTGFRRDYFPYISGEDKPLSWGKVLNKRFWVFFSRETEITDFLFKGLVKQGLEQRSQSCLMLAYAADPISFVESISDINIDDKYEEHIEQIESKYLKLIKDASSRDDVKKLIEDKEIEIKQLYDSKLFSFINRQIKRTEMLKKTFYGNCLQLSDISSSSIISHKYREDINLIENKLEEQLKGCLDIDRIMQAKAVADLEKSKIIDSEDLKCTLYNSDDLNSFTNFKDIVQLALDKGQEEHKIAALYRIWSSNDSKWVGFVIKNQNHLKQYPDELLLSISNKCSPNNSFNLISILLNIENVIIDKNLWNDVYYQNLKLIRENANKNHIVILSSLIKQLGTKNPVRVALDLLQYKISKDSDHVSINKNNDPKSVHIQVKKNLSKEN